MKRLLLIAVLIIVPLVLGFISGWAFSDWLWHEDNRRVGR
jgi:hypothetical protein